MSKFSPLRGGNEEYGDCDDEEQEKALALLWRPGSHFRPRLTLFSEKQANIPAVGGFPLTLRQILEGFDNG